MTPKKIESVRKTMQAQLDAQKAAIELWRAGVTKEIDKDGRDGERENVARNSAEKRERGRSVQRFRFLRDDDCHTYLVPVGKEEEFARWVSAGPYWENYEGEEFESIGCCPSCFTFTDPQEDK